jgi:hypothetical protein
MAARREPDFHELMRPPHQPNLLRDLSRRLRLLAQLAETPNAHAEIAAALASPWWGLRVLAIRVIGSWAGARSAAGARQRAWLTERARRPLPQRCELWSLRHGDLRRWQAEETETARLALSPHVTAGDAGWILDLWFDDFERFSGLHLALMSKLPPEPIMARIVGEIAGGERSRCEAVLWLLFNRQHLPGRDDAFARLAASPDKQVASLACRLSAMVAARESEARLRGS